MMSASVSAVLLTVAVGALNPPTAGGTSGPPAPQAGLKACGPVDDGHRTAEDERIRPGTYYLTLVEDASGRRRAMASGRLWLAPTSENDRSPNYPDERPARRDHLRAPLYGSTDVDLFAVDAALQIADLNTDPDIPLPVPAPGSWDPLHPGVLGLVEHESPDGPRQMVLLIGTGANRRVGSPGLDRVGIILRIRHYTNDEGFEGTWGPYATTKGGAGYFCAVRQPKD